MTSFSHKLAAVLALGTLMLPLGAHADGGEWATRRPVTISNPNATELRDYQTRLVLDAANFDFDRAQPGGGDLRITDSSGTKQLSYFVEQFDAASKHAIVWVKVPYLPASGSADVFVYSANATAEDLSSGRRTFELFDDFGKPGLGYYAFGAPSTILTKTAEWETQSPHTLSVVELNRDGFKYWGYYGLADCGGIGLVRSNDLQHWQRTAQPLLHHDGERWPSAVLAGGTVYMIYDRDHCGISHLVLRTSTDGMHFSEPHTVIVRQEQGVRNQNPALFHDPISNRFYLYWFRGGSDSGFWQIKMRSADTVVGLADESSEQVLIDVPYELAAPNMMYADGTYFLSTEVNENAWKTKIYASASPNGPFAVLPDAPQLSDNQACLFQHVLTATVMNGYICKIIGTDWVLQARTADLSRGRLSERSIDPGVWQAMGGTWQTAQVNDGILANIVVSATAQSGWLKTALPGADYAFSARGRASSGGWGVAVRSTNLNNFTRVRLQADGNLVIEQRANGSSIDTLATAPVPNLDVRAWHTLQARIYGRTVEAWVDGVLVAKVEGEFAPDSSGNAALLVDGSAQFDDAIWRKVVPLEPTAQFGPVETRAEVSANWLSTARAAPLFAQATAASMPNQPAASTTTPPNQSPVWAALAALCTFVGMAIVGIGMASNRR